MSDFNTLSNHVPSCTMYHVPYLSSDHVPLSNENRREYINKAINPSCIYDNGLRHEGVKGAATDISILQGVSSLGV